MAQTKRARILILGGGFGGVYTAMTLEKRFRGAATVDITLVSKENYLVFQPMLPEVLSGSMGLLDVITPIRRLCPRTTLYTRTVESIDLANHRVTAPAGFGSQQYALEYDHLVLALGNVTSFAGQPGLGEHALPFKYLDDALTLRNHVIHVLEDADIEPDPDVRQALLTFVVAGGGFSGVEAVAALNDFIRQVAKHFRHIKPADLRVILLHAGERLLPELPDSLPALLAALRALGDAPARSLTALAQRIGVSEADAATVVTPLGEHPGPLTEALATAPTSPLLLMTTPSVASSKTGAACGRRASAISSWNCAVPYTISGCA